VLAGTHALCREALGRKLEQVPPDVRPTHPTEWAVDYIDAPCAASPAPTDQLLPAHFRLGTTTLNAQASVGFNRRPTPVLNPVIIV